MDDPEPKPSNPKTKHSKLMLQLSADDLMKLDERGISQAQFESFFEKEIVERKEVRGLCFTCWRKHGRGKTKRCDRCHTSKYCSRVCQKEDWVGIFVCPI